MDSALAVVFKVRLCGLACVVGSMLLVTVRQLCVLGSLFVITGFMMLGRFPMMLSCLLVMFGSLNYGVALFLWP
jgi:hypothetical protein